MKNNMNQGQAQKPGQDRTQTHKTNQNPQRPSHNQGDLGRQGQGGLANDRNNINKTKTDRNF